MTNYQDKLRPTSFYSFVTPQATVDLGWLLGWPVYRHEVTPHLQKFSQSLIDDINELMFFMLGDEAQDIDFDYLEDNAKIKVIPPAHKSPDADYLLMLREGMAFEGLRKKIEEHEKDPDPAPIEIEVVMVPNQFGQYKWISDHAGNCDN